MYQFDKSILEMDKSKLLGLMITKFESEDKKRIEMLQRYYKGKHDTILNKKTAKGKPNNKVVNPFANLIVNTVKGYLVGQPVKYISNNQEALDKVLDIYYNNDEEDLNSEIVQTMSTCGEAYEYIYINEDKEIEFVQLPVNETILVYDNDLKPKMLMCIRYYISEGIDGKKIYNAEIYTDSTIEYYSGTSSSTMKLTDEYTHIFGQVPVIHYKNNAEMIGDFEIILSLIDDADKIISSDSDENEYFRNAYMIIKGFGEIDEKTMAQIRQTGAFVLPTTDDTSSAADVSFITKDLNTVAVHKHLEVIMEHIHKFSQVPNFADQKMATAESGAAMKQKVWGFEQLTGVKQRKLEQGLFQRLRLVLRSLEFLGINSVSANEFSLRFTRNLPTNIKEDAEILSLLGITSEILGEEAMMDIISKISVIQDPKKASVEFKNKKNFEQK